MDNPSPVVSVIIVNYETSSRVKACIESLQTQVIAHEIIVVDNPSPKNDAADLKGVRAQLVLNSTNVGYGLGCNAGAEKARGEYICILNPDTVIPVGQLDKWITACEDLLSAGHRVGIVAPQLRNENGTVQRSVYRFPNAFNYWLYHSLFGGLLKQIRKAVMIENSSIVDVPPILVDWVMGAALLLPKNAWNAVNGFSCSYFLYAEDTDLCWRLRLAGYSVFFAPTVFVIHTQGESSPETRARSIERFFNGLRVLGREHYGQIKRWSLQSCVILDMIARLAIFAPLLILRPGNIKTRQRTKGYASVLSHYLTGGDFQHGADRTADESESPTYEI